MDLYPSIDPKLRTRRWALGLFLAVGMAVALGALWVTGWWLGMLVNRSDEDGGKEQAEKFLDDLASGRIDQAYARVSPRFRTEMTLDQLRYLVKFRPVLASKAAKRFESPRGYLAGPTTGARRLVRVHVEGNPLIFDVVLSTGMGPKSQTWEIDDLLLP